MKRAIQMKKNDNVATALETLEVKEKASVVLPSQEVIEQVEMKQAVPFGHKLAIKAIAKGDAVIKYGETIGQAAQNIERGEYVHIHNVTSNRMQLPGIWYRK
jgi:altronate dehydratase small subunit